ncbi:MAG: peptide chain release factor-like protein [Planctomycetota bacterium]
MNLDAATVRDLQLNDVALSERCTVQRMARGGPGGQHTNKTASGIRLIHRATGLISEASEHRDGLANRGAALQRLRLLLACSMRGGSDQRWLAPHVRRGRLACGPTAASWPGVVACLLDLLVLHAGRLTDASKAAGLSTTQYSKALAADPEVRRVTDAIRRAHGLSRLRS